MVPVARPCSRLNALRLVVSGQTPQNSGQVVSVGLRQGWLGERGACLHAAAYGGNMDGTARRGTVANRRMAGSHYANDNGTVWTPFAGVLREGKEGHGLGVRRMSGLCPATGANPDGYRAATARKVNRLGQSCSFLEEFSHYANPLHHWKICCGCPENRPDRTATTLAFCGLAHRQRRSLS